MDLQGARALVAGATGELGGRLARALAGQGAHVAVAGRDERRLDALAAQLGAPALALELRDLASVRACVDEAAERLGGLDLVVLATGVGAFGDTREVDEAITDEVFAVNVLGPAALVRHALAHTGFSTRALVGTPSGLPDPEDADEVVERILDAVRHDRRDLHWDLKSNRLVTG